MNTRAIKERIAEASPRLRASIIGVFYLLTIIAGGVVLFIPSRMGFAVVTACYLAVAALLYDLFRPASKSFSRRAPSRNLMRQTARLSKRIPRQVRRTL
jgi:hypothetical protein